MRDSQTTGLRGVLTAERAAVVNGDTSPCGHTCDDGCHGPLTCIRAEHVHDPDADMGQLPDGRPAPKGNVTPHLAHQADGTLHQWTCLPGDHDGLTSEQRAAKRATDAQAAREQVTRDLHASIDPALLAQLIREGGHL